MKIPTIVNLQVIDSFGNKNIVGAVIDFDPSAIKEIMNGSEEGTTVIYTMDNRPLVVMIPFQEVLRMYLHNQNIVGDYKDEVFDYLKDNWVGYRNSINKKGDTNQD